MSDDNLDQIARIENRLDRRFDRLEEKLDRALERVSDYETRLGVNEAKTAVVESRSEAHERRINDLEDASSSHKGEQGLKRWFFPAAATVLGSAWWVPELLKHSGHS